MGGKLVSFLTVFFLLTVVGGGKEEKLHRYMWVPWDTYEKPTAYISPSVWQFMQGSLVMHLSEAQK